MAGNRNSTVSTSEQKLGNVRIQSSSYGLTLPMGYGRNRIPGNLLWYASFVATAHTSTTSTSSGGKGGSVTTTQSNTTYTYGADAIMGLCEGPIASIHSLWKGKDRYSTTVLSGTQTTKENLAVPSTRKVKLSFNSFTPSVSAVVLVQDTSGGDVALALTTDYTVVAGVITIVNSAYIGRTIRVTYTWTPPGGMMSASADVGLSAFQGSWSQATWSYLATNYSSQAIPYNNTAYVAGASYPLNNDATFANHNFEVNFKLQYSSSNPDANPADMLVDFLTNPDSGAQFPPSRVYDMTQYSNYCRAFSLFMSPTIIEQAEAREVVKQLMLMTNSEAVWSQGMLKIVPYGDTAATANGATYTPNLTPLYDLDDTDFLVSGEEDPVIVNRKTSTDAFNVVKVEFLNRANSYNTEIVEKKDQASIETVGLRPRDPISMHAICEITVAGTVAQMVLQRDLYIRNQYTFRLGWRYALLEPMDLVTLTDSGLGLSLYAVRIKSIDENDNGDLTVTAEDFPVGIAHATLYPDPTVGGYATSYNVAPGSVVAPLFFEYPIDYTPTNNTVGIAVTGASANWGGCSIWMSLDGLTYKLVGRQYGGSRYGTITVGMTSAAGQVASVALAGIGGQMLSGTNAEADADATAILVGTEYMDHTTATLTGTNAYNLTSRNRGRFGTKAAAHSIGASFVRFDQATTQVGPLDLKLTGTVMHFKFTSFNIYGRAEESLAAVTDYTYTITRDVSSDNLLEPKEKKGVIYDYTKLVGEQVGLDSQADSLTIIQEKADYDAALAALIAYMATLTAPVAWNNLNGNTIL